MCAAPLPTSPGQVIRQGAAQSAEQSGATNKRARRSSAPPAPPPLPAPLPASLWQVQADHARRVAAQTDE
eukprot:363469-Chlamydomonas_euryale.AAC.2